MENMLFGLVLLVGSGCLIALMIIGVMVVYTKAMREIQITKEGKRDVSRY